MEIMLKNDQAYQVIGEYDEHILLYRDMDGRYEVHAFDQEMRKDWERVIDFEKKNAEVYSIIPQDTAFHLIYGYRYKGDFYLKHHTYNGKCELVGTNTLAIKENVYFTPRFLNIESEDRSKLLIFRVDKESEVGISVYEPATQRTLWSRQILFQTGSLRRDFRQALVSNNGDMMLLLDHERSSMRNKEFLLLRIQHDDNVLRRKYIKLDGFSAFDMHASYDNINDRLMLAGMYSEKSMGKSVGLYSVTMGMYDKSEELRILPIDIETIEEVTGKDVNKNKGLADFVVADIIFRQDGGALILSEMQKEYSRRPNVPMRRGDFGGAGWIDFYYEDVIVYSLHPDGQLHWNTVLHKKQYSQDDDGMYSSYFIFMTPEKMRLLFNDEIRMESTISEYVVRGNGFHRRSSVFSTD